MMVSLRRSDVKAGVMKEGDPRIGHLLGTSLTADTTPVAVIVGFPTDEGVRRNGGRPGAALAPDVIRRALYSLAPDARDPLRFSAMLGVIQDVGDLETTGDLERDQEMLGEFVGGQLKRGVVPIVLGGGHETAFGHFLGYVKAGIEHRIVNIDAHPDVRPLIDARAHSGSPFYQALLHPENLCRRYDVMGLLPQSASAHHCHFIGEHGGSYQFREDLCGSSLSQLLSQDNPIPTMVTLDLDALDQVYAPGVSAPATDGVDLSSWLSLAECAGARREVSSLDIVELNPNFDIDNRTAKVAAMTVWRFIRGLVHRFAMIEGGR